eukprot:TRINITY_DN125_c0_g1_i1.p1 TRINITY_DN125_c0_g1~~TRINITY_DN125_c0_g1_i1.p1  ORF type:complete len:625 (-),score=84.67 TRINITY_DN125_c0_g1_i1:650-2524(-)
MGVPDEEGRPAAKRPRLFDTSDESADTCDESRPPDRPLGLPPHLGRSAPPTHPGGPIFNASMGGKSVASSSSTVQPIPSDSDRIGSRNQIRKVEFIRLITQSLYSLGYPSAASRLEEESHLPLQSRAVGDFRDGILEGRWCDCVRLLTQMQLDEHDLKNSKFLILQQQFLELLEQSDTTQALKILRSDLAPLGIHTKRLHLLASLVMCTSEEDLREAASWSGAGGDSRYRLLVDLQDLLPPSIMIPERRLERLVEQALHAQREGCMYHNTMDQAFSLYADHQCGRDQIPSETTQVLEKHTDEVWYLHFSHDGKRLASASKDQTVIIWEVGDGENARVQHRLESHSKPLSFLAWSPTDVHLLTCGNDKLVKLWDTATGACLRTFDKHTEFVSACAWFPDGKRFVSGSLDKTMYLWDTDGNELQCWKGPDMPRINDLAVSDDGKHMVSICNEKEIRIYSFEDGVTHRLPENNSITSLAMSSDGRCILVNLSTGFIHLWDGISCRGAPPEEPAFKYTGQVQGRFVIRSSFGGSDQAFIVSGSEDSQVYIWHRGNGELLAVLPGHSGTVNAVSWNPTNPHMFASASDDRTIRLWGVPKRKRHMEPGSSSISSLNGTPTTNGADNGRGR